jgi:GTPase Era involved in 16S rRNA processing
LVGKFNVGKSFIIKLLSEVYVKTGDTLHTIGIEFYKAKGDILFLDVAGEKNPVRDEPGYILDRRLIDYFVEEVVQETSMSHIHVVNRIDNTDQEKLMKLRARANVIKS